jgi:prepilin-type N-terminal cleavage/methylation domain-containing protein
MNKQLRKDNKGFTIIEVLIVLAIAGLIMVIVFIAVPQLQRGQRNNARENDASLIASAISECLTNRNGVTDSCNSVGGQEVTLPTNLNQIPASGVSYNAATQTGSTTTAVWTFGLTCSTDNQGTSPGSQRQFVVRYQVEGANGAQQRCIAG